MDLERDGNMIEAGVWLFLSLALVAYSFSQPKPMRPVILFLSVTMAVFGGSDLVEARTGAWWTPWWLFVWKVVCVIGLFLGFVRYFRLRKAVTTSVPPGNGDAP